MVNYKKIALNAITKRNCPGFHNNTIFLINVTFALIWRHFIFGHVRVAKMVNYKKIDLKGNYK